MPTICRLLQLLPDEATALVAEPSTLAQAVKSAKIYSDVYRYWDGIQYLLAQHRPTSVAAKWLSLGAAVSAATDAVPAARVVTPQEVTQLDAVLREVPPDDLIPHYEADALDQAGVYPRTWTAWEETFDPLGQVLEHYSFLQMFVAKRTADGDALLLYFEPLDDGSV
jgi:Domain of unknown function (DUF1877)